MPRTFGVIPAAGKSRRMGRPKLSLPLGEMSVLESVINALRQGGVDDVVVVIAPGEPGLRDLATMAKAHVSELAAETPQMRDTVESGLNWLEARFQPQPEDFWLLLPADHPCIDNGVVQTLLEHEGRGATGSIVIPTFQGRRGHPVLISWRHVPGIRALAQGLGLNSYLRRHANEIWEAPVSTPSVLWDLDTPEDYQRLLEWKLRLCGS